MSLWDSCRRGLVLFSSEVYNDGQPQPPPELVDSQQLPGTGIIELHPSPARRGGPPHSPGRHIAAGHLTNLACNSSGTVWGLDQLQQALGRDAFALLWKRIELCSAATLRAAQGPLMDAHNWLRWASRRPGTHCVHVICAGSVGMCVCVCVCVASAAAELAARASTVDGLPALSNNCTDCSGAGRPSQSMGSNCSALTTCWTQS